MPFDRYMSMALYEPGLGYYVNGLHKFGPGGDFVTAPEQGTLFAASLARQIDAVAGALGDGWSVLELGAGSGALSRDLLERLQQPPAQYLIVEPSAVLRQVQAKTLAALPTPLQGRVEWLDAPPADPFSGVMVANEVLDALPVARFALTDQGWVEHCVAYNGHRLVWQPRPPRRRLEQAIERLAGKLGRRLPTGYTSELSLNLAGLIETVTAPLARGLVLLIDYGYPRDEYYHPQRSDGTLVCHYRHRAHFEPFAWPGLTDISAFVDFTAAAEAGAGAGLEVSGFTSQAGFLLGLGAADALALAGNERERLKLAGELKRLTLPAEMGEKFKVLGLTRDLDQPLEGFEMMSQLHRL